MLAKSNLQIAEKLVGKVDGTVSAIYSLTEDALVKAKQVSLQAHL